MPPRPCRFGNRNHRATKPYAVVGEGSLQNELARAQHYRALEKQLRETAGKEPDEARRVELVGLAEQYSRLADKLIGQRAQREDL